MGNESDSDENNLRALQLAKLEAEIIVRPYFYSVSRSCGVRGVFAEVGIQNLGLSDFAIKTCSWKVRWNAEFQKMLIFTGRSFPSGYQSPSGEFPIIGPGVLKPSEEQLFKFIWTRGHALEHFEKVSFGITEFNGLWGEYDLAVSCKGVLGGTALAEYTVVP